MAEQLGSLALSGVELVGVIMLGAAIGAAAVPIGGKIYTAKAPVDANKPTTNELLMAYISAMIPPILVAIAAPFLFAMIPGSDAGSVFGVIFALMASSATLQSKVSDLVGGYF